MVRPRPTKQFLTDLAGRDQAWIEKIHHGLDEVPAIGRIYPHLNLSELLVFAAESRNQRETNYSQFWEELNCSDFYSVLNNLNKDGFARLNGHVNRLPPNQRVAYDAMNPFDGKLEERLARVPEEHVDSVVEQLMEKTNDYVFEIQYPAAKRRHDWDSSKIRVMTFQNVYPKSGRIIPAYSAEVARIIKSYGNQFIPL